MLQIVTAPIVVTYSASPKPLAEDRPERFDCFLEDGTKLSPPSGFKFPVMDSARELLKRGYSPALPMTSKVRGSSTWSWEPRPIAAHASVTVRESQARSISLRAFEAYLDPQSRNFVQDEVKQAA
jgi:hypothetical protein